MTEVADRLASETSRHDPQNLAAIPRIIQGFRVALNRQGVPTRQGGGDGARSPSFRLPRAGLRAGAFPAYDPIPILSIWFWPIGRGNQRRDFMQTIKSATGGELMAAWMASGGAIEALDGAQAQATRSRRHAAAGDDGLQAGRGYTLNFCGDDELEAGAYTVLYCATDDGIQASRPSIRFCIDDGIKAGRVTGSPPICIDDGLQTRRD